MEWSFNSVGPVTADLDLPSGEIEVSGDDGDTIRVVLEPYGPFAGRATQLIEASTVRLDGSSLRVHVPSRAFRNAEIRCAIVVPERSALSVSTASADISCEMTLGSFRGSVASGDVRLGDVDGDLSLNTASGDLQCGSVKGSLKVKGASADVSARSAGDRVDITLASGDIEIGEVGGSAKVQTASGDVEIGCAYEGEVTIKSASGDISVGVPEGTNAYLDISTVTGDTKCSLPVGDSPSGDSKLKISCQTMSGDVSIRQAQVGAGRAGHD